MKKLFSLSLIFILNMVYSQNIQSPSQKIAVEFKLTTSGQPSYSVKYNNKPVISESTLGIKLKDKPSLDANFEIENTKTATFNESWKPVLGEQAIIVNHYNELTVSLIQKGTQIKFNFQSF